jgi:hypothetical protein
MNYGNKDPDKSDLAIWNLVARVTRKSARGDVLLKRCSAKRASLVAMISGKNG